MSDYFSPLAHTYAKHRPHYPDSLFRYLSGLTSASHWAWDAGTGSGQAAIGLTPYFDRVYATDRSELQIRHALRNPGICYAAAVSSASALATESIDLIVAAQALHWFDRPGFFAEAARVLKPAGVIAAWCYGRLRVSSDVQPIVDRLYQTVQSFWPQGRELVDNAYRSIEFPFNETAITPDFMIECSWTADDLLGYMHTWTATQRYRDHHQSDPVEAVAPDIHVKLKTNRVRAQWPIHMRVGRAS